MSAAEPIVELAAAVLAALANETWSQEFTPAKAYSLTAELADDGLHVDVAVREAAGELVARGTTEETLAVDVAVRQKGAVAAEAVEPLLLLLREIKDHFFGSRLDTVSYGAAVCVGWDAKPLYYETHLRTLRQFTGVRTLRFRLRRAV